MVLILFTPTIVLKIHDDITFRISHVIPFFLHIPDFPFLNVTVLIRFFTKHIYILDLHRYLLNVNYFNRSSDLSSRILKIGIRIYECYFLIFYFETVTMGNIIVFSYTLILIYIKNFNINFKFVV